VADILVVDDDQAVAAAFERFLTFEGHQCRLASSGEAALRAIEDRRPNLVLMDIRMPGVDGLTMLKQLRERFPGIYIVMMTAYGSSQTSIDAIRAGAFEYLTKPLDLDQLRGIIQKAVAAQASGINGNGGEDVAPPVTLIGETATMLDVYRMIGRLATNDAPALIVGERGSGKRLVVATIHDNSARRDERLLSVACGTASETEVSQALFAADPGTVALADVDRLPSPLQAMVAQALGAARTRGSARKLNARILATSERELTDAVRDGFNHSLADELGVITLRIPPLRERREDIPLLVRHFIQRFNVELNRSIKGIDEAAAKTLHAYTWPGNVAELERAIKRASIVARSEVITLDDLGGGSFEALAHGRPDVETALERSVRDSLHERLVQADSPGPSPYRQILDAVETTLVTEALAITKGNQVRAAEILGVNRATLRKKMPIDS
jgi:DNA-binding NtrC family response regulator